MNIKPFTLIRVGLALVFLANSLNAFLNPGEFVELINNSFLSGILPVTAAHFVTFIGINDGLIALSLFLGFDLALVTIWAAIWIFGVMVIKGFSLETLEEAGFLFMALDLIVIVRGRSLKKSVDPSKPLVRSYIK